MPTEKEQAGSFCKGFEEVPKSYSLVGKGLSVMGPLSKDMFELTEMLHILWRSELLGYREGEKASKACAPESAGENRAISQLPQVRTY